MHLMSQYGLYRSVVGFHYDPQSFAETVGSLPQKRDITTMPSTDALSSYII
jgi:hypothetical protein